MAHPLTFDTMMPGHYHGSPKSRAIHPHDLDIYSSPRDIYDPPGFYTYRRTLPAVPNFRDSAHSEMGDPIFTKDGFQVLLDVHQFSPKEITVKTVGNSIFVDASHDERPDIHGHIARQFTRRYSLPDGFNANYVVPELSSDGILTIKGLPEHKVSMDENVLQIKHTGPALHHVKTNDKAVSKENGN